MVVVAPLRVCRNFSMVISPVKNRRMLCKSIRLAMGSIHKALALAWITDHIQ